MLALCNLCSSTLFFFFLRTVYLGKLIGEVNIFLNNNKKERKKKKITEQVRST